MCVCECVCVRESERKRGALVWAGPCARWNLQEGRPYAAQTIGRPLQTSVPIGVARTVLASQGRSRRRRAGRRRQGGHSGCAPIHPHSGRPPPRRIPVRRLCCLAASVNEAPRQPRERRAGTRARSSGARGVHARDGAVLWISGEYRLRSGGRSEAGDRRASGVVVREENRSRQSTYV